MKFTLVDPLVQARNGLETTLEKMCSSDAVEQCGGQTTPGLVGGKNRHPGRWCGDGSKTPVLGSDVHIYQSMIF